MIVLLIAVAGLVLSAFVQLKAALVSSKAAAAAAGRKEAEAEELQEWKVEHEREARQRDRQIAQLTSLASSAKATQDGMERRLHMLEERRSSERHQGR